MHRFAGRTVTVAAAEWGSMTWTSGYERSEDLRGPSPDDVDCIQRRCSTRVAGQMSVLRYAPRRCASAALGVARTVLGDVA